MRPDTSLVGAPDRKSRSMSETTSDFDRLGETALRRVIEDFVDACFDDMMIGYMFPPNKRPRVKEFEYQHAAAHLGGTVEYAGRTLEQAHGPHRIMGGQFDRRLTLLRQTLERHEVPEDILGRWVAYHESLRARVTTDKRGQCVGSSDDATG